MNSHSRDCAKQVAFNWIDTRETRPAASEIPTGVIISLKQYDLVPVPWKQREQFAERLAA